MPTKQSELLNTQGNVDDNLKKNYPLINRKPIPKTPFTIIEQEEKFFISIGNIKITEPTDTEDEQIEKLQSEQWNITLALIAWTIEKNKEITKMKEGGFDPNK